MFSLLAILGIDKEDTKERILNHTSAMSRSVLPSIEGPLESMITLYSNIGLGLMLVQPEHFECRSPISVLKSKNVDIFMFGSLTGTLRGADGIADAYNRTGAEGVKNLNGSFCCVIIDKVENLVLFISDPIGHQTFRWVEKDGRLYVSSHDIPLILSGAADVAVDSVSVLSALLFEWSIEGKPLLDGVQLLDPQGWLEWKAGTSMLRYLPSWFGDSRVEEGNTKDAVKLVDELIDTLRFEGRSIVQNYRKIIIGLTGGIDSRLVLALLPDISSIPNLTAETSGGENSMDVVWARRLAQIIGISHKIGDTYCIEETEFERHLNLLAFSFNGDTNGCWALSPLKSTPSDEIRLTGGGGEIYRGYYYQYQESTNRGTSITESIIERMWNSKSKKRQLLSQDFVSNVLCDSLRSRIFDVFGKYQEMSSDSRDQLDLFYLMERFGRWGSFSSRRSWYNIGTPLACQDAIRIFFRLPSSIRGDGSVHMNAVWRYLPIVASVMPINGWRPIFLKERTVIAKGMKLIYKTAKQQRYRLEHFITGGPQDASERVRSNLMAENLIEVIRDSLLCESGLFTHLMPQSDIRRILDEFSLKRQEMLMSIIGFMLTIEYWYQQLKNAEQHAWRG